MCSGRVDSKANCAPESALHRIAKRGKTREGHRSEPTDLPPEEAAETAECAINSGHRHFIVLTMARCPGRSQGLARAPNSGVMPAS